jgi:peptidoglycan/LPS O-acetylase OafA/YrhL
LIDGLRAAAALSIVVFHTTQAGYFHGAWATKLTIHLNAGVPLFFAISGFVLFRPYLAAYRLGAPRIGLRGYLVRRVVRIVPAYWTCLVIAGAAVSLPGVFTPAFFYFFGFLQIYSAGHVYQGLVVAWSLCTGMSFYVLLPLIAAGLIGVARRRERVWHWTMLIALAVPAIGAVAFHLAVEGGRRQSLGLSIAGSFYLFYVGMALAIFSVRAAEDKRARRLLDAAGRYGVILWLVAATGFVLIAIRVSSTSSGPVWPPYGFLAALVLLPAIAPSPQRAIAGVLRWRPLAFVGSISYGVYLWHIPVLAFINHDLRISPGSAVQGVGVLALCTLLAVFLAWLSYTAIERPCIIWSRRSDSQR